MPAGWDGERISRTRHAGAALRHSELINHHHDVPGCTHATTTLLPPMAASP